MASGIEDHNTRNENKLRIPKIRPKKISNKPILQ